MSKDELYDRLGVPKDATKEQIGQQYRAMAKVCHPDKHPNDPDAKAVFLHITEAYETLGDDERRSEYDRTGHRPNRAAPTIKEQAMSIIAKILGEFIQAQVNMGADPNERNLLKHLQQSIEQNRQAFKKEIARLTRMGEKFADAAKRFKSKDDVIGKLLQSNVHDINIGCGTATNQLKVFDEAMALTDGASFDVKKAGSVSVTFGKYGVFTEIRKGQVNQPTPGDDYWVDEEKT